MLMMPCLILSGGEFVVVPVWCEVIRIDDAIFDFIMASGCGYRGPVLLRQFLVVE